MNVTVNPEDAKKIESFMQKASNAGYSDDEIKSAIQRKYGNPGNPMRGTTGSFGAGASGSWEPQTSGERFQQGFMNDPITGLKQIGLDAAGVVAPQWSKGKQADIQKQEDQYQQQRQAAGESGVDWARLGGQIVNPVNLGIAAVTKTPPGASLLMRGLTGGAGGAAMGALAPVYGDSSRLGQTLAGAAGGVVGAPLTGGAARVISPKIDPNLALLRKEGITPTIGQSLGGMAKATEDKLTSFPITGDAINWARGKGLDQVQKAGYGRALKPIGGKIPKDVGFEGMQSVHKQLSNAYDDLLPNLSFKPDQTFIQDTATLRSNMSSLEPKDQKLFDSIVGRMQNRATPQGNMSGETFKNIESSIDDEIVSLKKDGSYEKGKVADALEQYRELMRQGLERSNPMHAQRLKKINEGWANYAILRDAASSSQAAKNEGVFTPAQLAAGVAKGAKRQGQAVGKGKLSEGRALMQDLSNAAQQVLPSKYPDSGTAGRLLMNTITNPVMGLPKMAIGATLGAAGSVPYLPGVRGGLDMLLNARPANADALAELVRRYPGLLAPVAPSIVNSGQNK